MLAVLLCGLRWTPAYAAPATLEFSGSVFNVADADDVLATTIGDTFSLFVTYDPDLLPGTPGMSGGMVYETAPGETAITFNFASSGGDAFVSDNSFLVRIFVENSTPPDTDDTFQMRGNFDPNTLLTLLLVESNLGTNPLSSDDLPTTGFGSGPGTWFVQELFVDHMFSRISGSVSNIEQVTTVPEPPTLALSAFGGLALLIRRRRLSRG
jgi:hypothetical protein